MNVSITKKALTIALFVTTPLCAMEQFDAAAKQHESLAHNNDNAMRDIDEKEDADIQKNSEMLGKKLFNTIFTMTCNIQKQSFTPPGQRPHGHIAQLIAQKANVNYHHPYDNSRYSTVLFTEKRKNQHHIITHELNSSDWTPLMLAMTCPQPDTIHLIRQLIDAKADVNCCSQENIPPLGILYYRSLDSKFPQIQNEELTGELISARTRHSFSPPIHQIWHEQGHNTYTTTLEKAINQRKNDQYTFYLLCKNPEFLINAQTPLVPNQAHIYAPQQAALSPTNRSLPTAILILINSFLTRAHFALPAPTDPPVYMSDASAMQLDIENLNT